MDDRPQWPIRADSARPETISYMQRHGFNSSPRRRKGQGSVEDGIEFLKSTTSSCIRTAGTRSMS
jgi:phage terminase large subunit